MKRAAATVCLIAAVVCVAAARVRADATRGESAPPTMGVATVTGLPHGLQWPTGDANSPVVDAVAADIDADGDLDIVANQGSLELVVWFNDGTGRLTRATATPSAGPHAFSTSPGFADPTPGTTLSVTTAAPCFDLAVPATSQPLEGGGAPTGPPNTTAAACDLTVRSSRAPPLDIRS